MHKYILWIFIILSVSEYVVSDLWICNTSTFELDNTAINLYCVNWPVREAVLDFKQHIFLLQIIGFHTLRVSQ